MRPELIAFSYTDDEVLAIRTAYKSTKPWDEKVVKDVKRRIKDFHLELNDDICCYCQRDLRGEFQMVIDVEHILPSSLYVDLTFEIWNLSSSCKRCNMLIKKDDIDFIDPTVSNFFSPAHYKFIHPNFDEIERHLLRCVSQIGKKRLVKYIINNSTKGAYSYDYFKLMNLETTAFDEAQGANLTDQNNPEAFEVMRARVQELCPPQT